MAPITQRGWSVCDLDLMPSNGDLRLDELGQVTNSVAATFAPNICRSSWLQYGENCQPLLCPTLGRIDIQRFITIASHPGHLDGLLVALVVSNASIALF